MPSNDIEDLRFKFENLEVQVLSFVETQTNEPQEELAKSLKEIEITYERSKERLEKDLNKMEFHLN